MSDKFVNWLSPPSKDTEIENPQENMDDELKDLLDEEEALNKKEQSEGEKEELPEDKEETEIEADEDNSAKDNEDTESTDIEDESPDNEKATDSSEIKEIDTSTTDEVNKEYSKVIELFEHKEAEENEKVIVSAKIDIEEEVDDDKNAESKKKSKSSLFDLSEIKAINKNQIAEGIKFGIGLAFLSMALNGLTDDLLFNIPTSMLMWIMVALAGAIEALPEKEEPRRRIKR